MPRTVIFGNAGSGKSTYASHLSRRDSIAHLDLDTIVWEQGRVAILRPAHLVSEDLNQFLAAHSDWVIEGCYSEWVELASTRCTELVFLNPGEEVCLSHCVQRPWEPHKFSSPAAQQELLAVLLRWVRDYYLRDDSCSLLRHRILFDEFSGVKRELTAPFDLQSTRD